MRLRFAILWLLLFGVTSRAAVPVYKPVTLSLLPIELLRSNLLDSATLTWSMDGDGRLTPNVIGATGSNNIANYNGTGTNLTIYSNLVLVGAASNATVYVTNDCVITGNDNTNMLVVSGAGTAVANGSYLIAARVSEVYTWTNLAANATRIIRDAGNFPNFYMISNAAGILYGMASDDPEDIWSEVTGSAPAPTAVYGTNFTTNCTSYLVSTLPFPFPNISSNLYVNPYLGNDGFALRGRIDRQWRTMTGALAQAVSGDCLVLSEGTHVLVDVSPTTHVPSGVNIKGAGIGLTIITNAAASPTDTQLDMGNNSLMSDLSSRVVLSLGSGGTIKTNVGYLNVECHGRVDGLFLLNWHSGYAVNCSFGSGFDAVADFYGSGAASNSVFNFWNCRLDATNTGVSGVIRGVYAGGFGTLNFNGGSSINAWNGSSQTAGVVGDTNNGCVNLSWVAIDVRNTNSNGAFAVTNNAGGRTRIVGGFTEMGMGVETNLVFVGGVKLRSTSQATAFTVNTNQFIVKSGSVGIGTNDPQAVLHVHGSAIVGTLDVLGTANVAGTLGATNVIVTNLVRNIPRTATFDGTNVFIDGRLGNFWNLTLTNNVKLHATNIQAGTTYIINMLQDGTGSRLLYPASLNIMTNASNPHVLSTAAGATDVLYWSADITGTNVNSILNANFAK